MTLPLLAGPAEGPLLIAHRGASQLAPENSLAAVRLAWKEGADGIEGDYYLTKDGRVVCIHDADTKRTAGVKLAVKESTLAELRALDIGAWKGAEFVGERIPTLEEVLAELPAGKWFFLEIKDSARIVPAIAKILRETKADARRVILISFDAKVVAACRKELPEFRACWISALKDFAKPEKADGFLASIRQSGSTGLAFKANAPVTADWLVKARGEDGILMAWTVNDRKKALRMAELGVGFVGTDQPAELRAAMAK